MRKAAGAIGLLMIVAVSGCSSDAPSVPPPSPPVITVPTTVPSSVESGLQGATELICRHVDDVIETLEDLEAGELSAEASTRLAEVAADLQEDAAALRASGQQDIATIAQTMALTLAGLQTVITQNPELNEQVQAAISQISQTLEGQPRDLCTGS